MSRSGPSGSALDRLAPALRSGLQGAPPTAFGLLISQGGMFVSDLAFNLRHDLRPLGAITVAGVTALLVGALAVSLMAATRRTSITSARRPLLVVAAYALAGLARSALLVLLNPYPSWALWLRELPSVMTGSLVWFGVSAVLVDGMDRAAAQRMRLDTEYRRLLATRAATEGILAATAAELEEVTATTRTAIAEISDRLHASITPAELDDCIERVESLVDREVRPHSHALARMPDEVRSADVPALWPSPTVWVLALVRRWPTARPFQADAVALASFPLVFADILSAAEPGRARVAAHAFLALFVQLAAVVLAATFLAPALRRAPRTPAIVVPFVFYTAMYVGGVVGLVLDAAAGVETPLSAHLFPSVWALMTGGAAAAAAQDRAESVGAARMISRIGHDLSRTRQQLWARRRRLATALHGRVQANLTAAGLLLRRARSEVAAGAPLDAQLVEQVRQAMRFAWQIDTRSPGTPTDRLWRVTQVWGGIMDVDLDVQPAARIRLEGDPDSAEACVEVVREVLLNAARHGGATGAAVRIQVAGADLVRIEVSEEGGREPAAPRSGSGLGEILLDAVTTHWSVRHADGVRVTTLLLPTGPAPLGMPPRDAVASAPAS